MFLAKGGGRGGWQMRLTRWRVHAYRRRRERVGGWEEQRAPVLAAGVWGSRRAGQDVVPF